VFTIYLNFINESLGKFRLFTKLQKFTGKSFERLFAMPLMRFTGDKGDSAELSVPIGDKAT